MIKEAINLIQLTETHFEYNNVSSRRYGLMFANIDTSRNLSLVGNVESVDVFNKRGMRNYLTGYSYDDAAFSTEVEIISDDDSPIDRELMREIERWLFLKHGYQKLYFDELDNEYFSTYEYVGEQLARTYINCIFINPSRIEGNGGVYGYKATLVADSAFAWQDETVAEYAFSADEDTSNGVITVTVDSDMDEYIYPEVTINVGETGGNITILNTSDDDRRYTSFKEVDANTRIIMDGEHNHLSPDTIYSHFGGEVGLSIDGSITTVSSRNFIRLLNGDNTFSITGDVDSITFKWNNRRWI